MICILVHATTCVSIATLGNEGPYSQLTSLREYVYVTPRPNRLTLGTQPALQLLNETCWVRETDRSYARRAVHTVASWMPAPGHWQTHNEP